MTSAARIAMLVSIPAACVAQPQQRANLYQCEGCEAIRERPVASMRSAFVIADSTEPGDRMVLSGRVVKPDGRTPAAGVIVYIHHTNAAGRYPTRGGDSGPWARRHGYLRGWVITDSAGNYRFESIRPAPYPGRPDPAHIHMTVKEPGRQEYWIDEVVFTDDTLVTADYRRREERRGGSGIVTPQRDNRGVWQVRRNIVLER
jgi:protocatechuate 3,4-dioxygenase, beta subunit